jgi:hypothetical protein
VGVDNSDIFRAVRGASESLLKLTQEVRVPALAIDGALASVLESARDAARAIDTDMLIAQADIASIANIGQELAEYVSSVPKVDLSRFEFPRIDLSQFEFPRVDPSQFEFPRVDPSMLELLRVKFDYATLDLLGQSVVERPTNEAPLVEAVSNTERAPFNPDWMLIVAVLTLVFTFLANEDVILRNAGDHAADVGTGVLRILTALAALLYVTRPRPY